MPFEPRKIHTRGYLPHWESTGATYAVTFRLADSLPAEVLARFQKEREEILEIADTLDRPLAPHELERLDYLYSEKIENFLDQGAGACHLRKPEIGKLVIDALHFFHQRRYALFTCCVMPNHVHALFRPEAPHTLTQILHSWKGYTAHRANQLLHRKGTFWMQESYDHLIRDESDFWHSHHYILDNPLKAGLPNWPWVKTFLSQEKS